jgi:Flp pilus assembly protein TadD
VGDRVHDYERRLAELQILAGLNLEALDTLQGLTKARPADPGVSYLLAVAGLRSKQWHKARRAIKNALARFPSDPGIMACKARLEIEEGDLVAAQDTLEALLAQEPERSEAHLLLGDVHYLATRYSDALAAYQSALRFEEIPELNFKIGLSFLQLERASEAALYLERAALDEGQQESALLALAVLYYRNPGGVWENSLSQAGQALDRLLEVNELSVAAHNLRGTVFGLKGHRGRMLDEFSTSLALEPNQPEVRALVERYHPPQSEASSSK